MAEFGFSTGILHFTEMPLVHRIDNFSSIGVNAIELSYMSSNILQANPNELSRKLKCFSWISIHAPSQNVRYSNDEQTRKILEKFAEFCDIIPVNGIVMHPNVVQSFSTLEKTNLPFLIENMDKRKDFYTRPEHFYDLIRNYDFGFVLDLQHAYEQDSTMNTANAMLDAFGNRLKEMHVSGSSLSSSDPYHEFHCPFSLAENKDALGKILRQNSKIPKILEGIVSNDVIQVLRAEKEYLQSFAE